MSETIFLGLNGVQLSWVLVGLVFGLILNLPIKRCLATHNGILSMLTASLMGIFTIPFSWAIVVLALICFSYGAYKNHHKYIGVTTRDSATN